MQTKRYGFTGILALVLLLGTLAAERADAGLQVRARVRIPGGVIQVQTPGQPVRMIHRVTTPAPRHRHVHAQVTRHDRQVAGRLARFTGVEKSELLRLRRLGYGWTEIGLWLELPRRAMVAVQDADTWSRYQRSSRRLGQDRLPAHGPNGGHCVVEDRDVRW